MIEIPLKDDKRFIIDDEDFERVTVHKWYVVKTGYIMRSYSLGYFDGKQKHKTVALHRFIMGFPEGKEIDHIDRDKLNNSKKNLRIVTRSQNNMNRDKTPHSSRFKGVCHRSRANRWEANIKINRKRVYIGLYETEIEAALAYNQKAIELHGEYARLNEVAA